MLPAPPEQRDTEADRPSRAHGAHAPRERAPSGAQPRARAVLASLRAAAWLVPLALPAAFMHFALIAAPWLSSLEAVAERRLIARTADFRMREAFADLLAALGGLDGLAVACVLASVAWLGVLQLIGVLRWQVLVPRLLGRHAAPGERGRMVLLALVAAALCAGVALAGQPMAKVADAVTGIRPTAPRTYALLFGTEALVLCAMAAIAGAVLPAFHHVASRRRTRSAVAVACACGLTSIALLLAGRALVADRFDVGRRLHEVVGVEPVGPNGPNGPNAPIVRTLAVATSSGQRVLRIADSTAGLPHDPHVAARLDEWLDERAGESTLADAAESYLLAERLAAFDPVGAQRTAWKAVRRRGGARTAHALLFGLASAPPHPASLSLARDLSETSELRLGPQALALLALALERQGDASAARDVRARLQTSGPERLGKARDVSAAPSAMVAGRVEIDGEPYSGPVGLVPLRDLLALDARDPHDAPGAHDAHDAQGAHGGEKMSPVTWLLRLSATGSSNADGHFALEGPATEQAVVVPAPAGALPSILIAGP